KVADLAFGDAVGRGVHPVDVRMGRAWRLPAGEAQSDLPTRDRLDLAGTDGGLGAAPHRPRVDQISDKRRVLSLRTVASRAGRGQLFRIDALVAQRRVDRLERCVDQVARHGGRQLEESVSVKTL